jgi:CheY-like chemotaxis protein
MELKTRLFYVMRRFELRSICNDLLAELNESTGKKNIIKLGIDIQLPDYFSGSADALENSIRMITQYLSERLINGIINIEITLQMTQGTLVTVHVGISGLGTSRRNLSDKSELNAIINKLGTKIIYKVNEDQISFEFSHRQQISVSPQAESKLQFPNSKILLAEDNEINAMVFSSFLEEWGVESTVVNNGMDAVSRIHNNLFNVDAVLMDIHMPMLNGIQATKMIREFSSTIPITALTASTRDEDIREAMDAGANDYLLKPVSSTHLFQILSKYL